MSTSRFGRHRSMCKAGFTLLELLVGLTLTMVIICSVAPLVLSLESASFRDADRTVAVLQGRVVVARLERDLRLASAGGSPFALEGPIIEAKPRQVVFLGTTGGVPGPCLVEWEIAANALMRRWGPCPQTRPASFGHALYLDNKSMLEGVGAQTSFAYLVEGELVTSVADDDLSRIRGVVLSGWGNDASGQWRLLVAAKAPVGR